MKEVEFLLENEKSVKLIDDSDLDLQEYSSSLNDIFSSDVLYQLTNSQRTESIIIRPSSIVAVKIEEKQEKDNDIVTDE